MENLMEDNPAFKLAAQMFDDARRIHELEIYTPHKLPPDAFELWSQLGNKGSRFSKVCKGDESPKICFARFIKRKRKELEDKIANFEMKYRMPFDVIDFDKSSSMQIVNKNGDVVAPFI
jgi:hypothetical protein